MDGDLGEQGVVVEHEVGVAGVIDDLEASFELGHGVVPSARIEWTPARGPRQRAGAAPVRRHVRLACAPVRDRGAGPSSASASSRLRHGTVGGEVDAGGRPARNRAAPPRRRGVDGDGAVPGDRGDEHRGLDGRRTGSSDRHRQRPSPTPPRRPVGRLDLIAPVNTESCAAMQRSRCASSSGAPGAAAARCSAAIAAAMSPRCRTRRTAHVARRTPDVGGRRSKDGVWRSPRRRRSGRTMRAARSSVPARQRGPANVEGRPDGLPEQVDGVAR